MSKKQVFNPYLPVHTYIPDGEPHVFGDRVYIFGSHDKEGGTTFCMLDYEVWSAPVNDLKNWTCHGISYHAWQDPGRNEKEKYMYAPDVVKGNDGRYYLYYAMAGGTFTGLIHVASAAHPEGPYEYYGILQTLDGKPYDRNITFDPTVINDNGTIRLYYGWALASPDASGISEEQRKAMEPMLLGLEMKMFGKTREQIEREKDGIQGAFTVTLADDMLTVLTEPVKILPGQLDAAGTGFLGHAFFEASSIRKIEDTYYFIYSSEVNHELCYATSSFPDRDFKYGGVIISNGDIGFHGRKPQDRLAITGNNHGSIENINGDWYIFYHRHTHKTCYSRQGCAEKIEICEDGSIPQTEMTSCGLNGGPLETAGCYPAVIACNLTNGKMPHISQDRTEAAIPYITEENGQCLIKDICDQTQITYKYFYFTGDTKLNLKMQIQGDMLLNVYIGDTKEVSVSCNKPENTLKSLGEWGIYSVEFEVYGTEALTLQFLGAGKAKLLEIGFE